MSPDASYPIGSVYTFSDVVTLLALYCCAVSFSPENLPDTGFPHGMQHTLGLYAPAHIHSLQYPLVLLVLVLMPTSDGDTTAI